MEGVLQKESIINDRVRKRLVRKNMVILLLGRLVSLFGTSIYTFAIGLYILKETGSGMSFALSIVLATIPRAILGPVAGVVADKFDKKKMAVSLDILSGIVVLILFLLSMFDGMKLIYIYGTTLILNVFNLFFSTTMDAGVPRMVDDENLTRINSLSQIIRSSANILGPAIGGMVFALVNIKIFLLVNGVSFVLSGISEIFIDFNASDKIYGISENEKEKKKSSFLDDLNDGFKFIAGVKWLIILGISAAFLNMFTTMGMATTLPVVMKNLWNFSDAQYGLVMATSSGGIILASLLISLIPHKEKNYKRLSIGYATFSLAMIFIGVFSSSIFGNVNNIVRLIVMMIVVIIIGFACVFINIPFMVTMQRMVPGEMLGRVMGVFTTLATVTCPIGALLGGMLVETVSPWIILVSCGTCMSIIAMIMAKNKEMKKI